RRKRARPPRQPGSLRNTNAACERTPRPRAPPVSRPPLPRETRTRSPICTPMAHRSPSTRWASSWTGGRPRPGGTCCSGTGTARARAAATARSVVALLGPPDRWPFAPDAEATDHRTVGFGSLRGGDAVLEAIRALLQLSDEFVTRIDDVLALRSDALLVRWTTS